MAEGEVYMSRYGNKIEYVGSFYWYNHSSKEMFYSEIVPQRSAFLGQETQPLYLRLVKKLNPPPEAKETE